MADWMIIAADFWNEYWLFVLGVMAIIGFGIFRWRQRVKIKKALRPKPLPAEPKVEDQPVPAAQEAPAPQSIPPPVLDPIPSEDSMAHLFSDAPAPSNKEDVVDKMKTMSNEILQEGASMDESLKQDFERLRQELRNVHLKRQEIKQHGLKLSGLYDKYRKREAHLTQMMANLEQMLQSPK